MEMAGGAGMRSVESGVGSTASGTGSGTGSAGGVKGKGHVRPAVAQEYNGEGTV